jgi:DNA (cytosine-5)-methyltransferase 1
VSIEQNEAREALNKAITRYSREELAQELLVDVSRIRRWEKGTIANPRIVRLALHSLLTAPPARTAEERPSDFTFVDLFAGIGGTRLGFEAAGGRCIFTSEYDRFCQQTYRANFHPEHAVAGDIREIHAESVPDHDVLVGGFPCQPFSIAGVSKKNALGRAHGFECKTQGTLFFEICRILETKRPPAFLLENVRNLRSHDGGKTFEVIMESLRELGYHVDAHVIDGRHWTPQHRERVYIMGFREEVPLKLREIALPAGPAPTLRTVLHPEDGSEKPQPGYTTGPKGLVDEKYTLTRHLWKYLQDYKKKHEAAGNGFGFGLVTPADVARTLSARYYKDGSEILISRGRGRNPRRLTPRECARLMGFPEKFRIEVSDTQAYKQFGNSVVVPVIATLAKAMKPYVLAVRRQLDTREQLTMVV